MKDIEINRNEPAYRFWEMLPGILTFGSFILPVVLSIFWPKVIASLIIVYAFYWLVKAFLMSGHLVIGYFKFKHDEKIDWFSKCKKLKLKNKSWQGIYHLMILATYKEEIETLRHSIKAIVDSRYPLEKVIFVLASEERDKNNALINYHKLEKEFGSEFFHFTYTMHPKDISGEVKGKGSNITYAAREIKKFIDGNKISYENIITTSLDADNRVHPQYLANLTYKYLLDPNPEHKSFQPLAMFFNNIWQVPLVIRSISVGSSFWQMIESTRPHRLRNFSAHAQSFLALTKTDFWSVKTIVEDGHQYWRSYFTYDGNYQVVPLYIPVYQDAVLSPDGYWDTFKEQYLQKRRWAWGCSDIPYVLSRVFRKTKLPFLDKWIQSIRLIEGHFSWATTSIILAFVGWVPNLINASFRDTVLAYNFPVIYSRILTVAMIGLAVTLTISMILLPPKPKGSLKWSVILEWLISPIMLPISNIIFSSLPAIDSQVRLFFGKYLGFRVTRKAVIEKTLNLHRTEHKSTH